MANIFANLVVGCDVYKVQNRRRLYPREYLAVVSVTVVPTDFGFSAEFVLKNGDKKWIPISAVMEVSKGMVLKPEDIEIVTLHNGELTIYRVEF